MEFQAATRGVQARTPVQTGRGAIQEGRRSAHRRADGRPQPRYRPRLRLVATPPSFPYPASCGDGPLCSQLTVDERRLGASVLQQRLQQHLQQQQQLVEHLARIQVRALGGGAKLFSPGAGERKDLRAHRPRSFGVLVYSAIFLFILCIVLAFVLSVEFSFFFSFSFFLLRRWSDAGQILDDDRHNACPAAYSSLFFGRGLPPASSKSPSQFTSTGFQCIPPDA